LLSSKYFLILHVETTHIHINFLTSFSSEGQKQGQFQEPAGIHITEDGYLLVSDFTNNQIQVFDVLQGESAF